MFSRQCYLKAHTESFSWCVLALSVLGGSFSLCLPMRSRSSWAGPRTHLFQKTGFRRGAFLPPLWQRARHIRPLLLGPVSCGYRGAAAAWTYLKNPQQSFTGFIEFLQRHSLISAFYTVLVLVCIWSLVMWRQPSGFSTFKKNACVTTELDRGVLFYIVCAVFSIPICVHLVCLIMYNPGHLQLRSVVLGGGLLVWWVSPWIC